MFSRVERPELTNFERYHPIAACYKEILTGAFYALAAIAAMRKRPDLCETFRQKVVQHTERGDVLLPIAFPPEPPLLPVLLHVMKFGGAVLTGAGFFLAAGGTAVVTRHKAQRLKHRLLGCGRQHLDRANQLNTAMYG